MADQGNPSPAQVEEHLKGIDFPAGKEALIRHARAQQAPDDVLAALEQMPSREYGNAADVARGIGQTM